MTITRFFENLPWDTIRTDLRERAGETSGMQGAMLGVGMGVASALAASKRSDRPLSAGAILAAAAMGLAYGVAQTEGEAVHH